MPPPPEDSAWLEHIPFATALVEMLRPRSYVELGVHTGTSYLAVCQAVVTLGLSCRCYGVDTFAGDEHSGLYGREVEARLRDRHDPMYGGFSRLIRSTFDEAAEHLEEGSVDLLHIDGTHTYEAVAADFERWLPKLSARGVVLFHDINVRERGFGVWRLWEELAERYPHFTFKHGHGLGLLAVGPDIPPSLAEFLGSDPEAAERAAALFFLLGNRITLQADLARHKRGIESLARYNETKNSELARLRHDKESESASLRHELDELRESLRTIKGSVSFRIGMRVTAPLRWVAEKLTARRA